MRTHVHSKNTDPLGRYYTAPAISSALVAQIRGTPSRVVDLASGQGSLTLAASYRWRHSSFITIDVDEGASKCLPQQLQEQGFAGRHSHHNWDALSGSRAIWLKRLRGQVDAALCNPPFQTSAWQGHFEEILSSAGLVKALPATSSVDAAVLFLAQNLNLVKPGGHIAIIVPDAVVSADRYRELRRELLRSHSVRKSIRLPRGAFAGTDALAHILVVEKGKATVDPVEMFCLDSMGSPIGQRILVPKERAIDRMDAAFQSEQSVRCTSRMTLGDVCIDIRRGAYHSRQVRESFLPVLHTTDIDIESRGKWLTLPEISYADGVTNAALADAGSILVARVGRTAALKVVGVEQGGIRISDCIFRISVQQEYAHAVLSQLSSERGRRWLDASSYGVAARVINKSHLLSFPLI